MGKKAEDNGQASAPTYEGALPETGPAITDDQLEAAIAYEERLRNEHPDWDDDKILDAVVAWEKSQTSSVDIDELPVVDDTPAQPAPTEEGALAVCETFDSAFAADPLKAQYAEFGTEAKELTDSTTRVERFVKLGGKCDSIMHAERDLAPGNYKRANVLKKLETTLNLYGVPTTYRADHFITAYWLVKLVLSTPGENGVARSFSVNDVASEWFRGNLTFGLLRVIAQAALTRVSRKGKDKEADELDVWDFKDHLEPVVRDIVPKIQAGTYSFVQTSALMKFHVDRIKREAEELALLGKTQSERENLELLKLRKEREAKFTKLRGLADAFEDFGVKELNQQPEQLRQILEEKSIIPTVRSTVTMASVAEHMTPGDAKMLVQCLAELYAKAPVSQGGIVRKDVIDALKNEIIAVVRSANEKVKNAPVKIAS